MKTPSPPLCPGNTDWVTLGGMQESVYFKKEPTLVEVVHITSLKEHYSRRLQDWGKARKNSNKTLGKKTGVSCYSVYSRIRFQKYK